MTKSPLGSLAPWKRLRCRDKNSLGLECGDKERRGELLARFFAVSRGIAGRACTSPF